MKQIFFLFLTMGFIGTMSVFSNTYQNTNSQIPVTDEDPLDNLFANINNFLGYYVHDGLVDYKSIKTENASIGKLLNMIATADLSNANDTVRKAFYLNVYNILVIKSVTDHYPVNSPMDVPGFFDKDQFTVAGSKMTLNEIENTKLRPDARVHFSLVCGALGCPELQATAFMPETVEEQLNSNTKNALNDSTYILVNTETKTVKVAQIFEWYKDDFKSDAGSVIAFLNKYRTVPIPENYKISTYPYNWKLNGL